MTILIIVIVAGIIIAGFIAFGKKARPHPSLSIPKSPATEVSSYFSTIVVLAVVIVLVIVAVIFFTRQEAVFGPSGSAQALKSKGMPLSESDRQRLQEIKELRKRLAATQNKIKKQSLQGVSENSLFEQKRGSDAAGEGEGGIPAVAQGERGIDQSFKNGATQFDTATVFKSQSIGDNAQQAQSLAAIQPDEFRPFTSGGFRTQDVVDAVLDASKTEPEQPPKVIPLAFLLDNLAREFFVCGVYNDLREGNFIKATTASFEFSTPPTSESAQVIALVPQLKKGDSIQLPFFLNGTIHVLEIGNVNYTIDTQGKLTVLSDMESDGSITYALIKHAANLDIVCEMPKSPWLEKEFAAIPSVIRRELDAASKKSDAEKLTVISSIFERYFHYQYGLKHVELPSDQSWCSYLTQILSEEKMLDADCDVLSAYVFIFCRYVGLPALFLTGYYNIFDVWKITPDEAHAAAYVKLDNRWVLFDPTLFALTIAVTAQVADKKAQEQKTVSAFQRIFAIDFDAQHKPTQYAVEVFGLTTEQDGNFRSAQANKQPLAQTRNPVVLLSYFCVVCYAWLVGCLIKKYGKSFIGGIFTYRSRSFADWLRWAQRNFGKILTLGLWLLLSVFSIKNASMLPKTAWPMVAAVALCAVGAWYAWSMLGKHHNEHVEPAFGKPFLSFVCFSLAAGFFAFQPIGVILSGISIIFIVWAARIKPR